MLCLWILRSDFGLIEQTQTLGTLLSFSHTWLPQMEISWCFTKEEP
jgi:hypothetical protein